MQIPLRATPRRVSNLLVTGRAIGGDRIAHATRTWPAAPWPGRGAPATALSIRRGETDTSILPPSRLNSSSKASDPLTKIKRGPTSPVFW
jgi:hypothetical protein